MKRTIHVLGLALVVALAASACATPDQRSYYLKAIEQFTPKLPRGDTRCWLTPDLNGANAGSNYIAEEVFTAYLIEKNLCKVVEKHPDDVAGYTWPKDDVCPCQAGQQTCSAQCAGGGAAAAAGGLGFGSIGGGGGDDNNRSNDKLLERHKKSTIPQKLIIYRIDELTQKKAVVHFRVADARTGIVDAAQTVAIETQQPQQQQRREE